MSGVREAGPRDLTAAARLLDAFNREYDEPTPGADALEGRLGELVATGDAIVLLAGDGPEGLALLRFRPALWTPRLECHLAELYVVPERRRRGLGLALMEAALDAARVRGADTMDLGTSVDDRGAIALYERLGFTNREGGPDGPSMLYYERDLRDDL